MSRGPGRWQRAVLERVELGEPFYLMDLLSDDYTMSAYKALHRAACSLADAGKIGYWRFVCGTHKIILTRPGAGKPDRMAMRRARFVSVDKVTRWHPVNTYRARAMDIDSSKGEAE